MKHISNLIISFVTCLLVFLWWIGGWNWLVENNTLMTILSCGGIFAFGTVFYGLSYYKPDLAWLGADNCITLGLFFTIVGLIIALPNIENTVTAANGIALALMTTGMGLFCNFILYNHGYALGLGNEESIQ